MRGSVGSPASGFHQFQAGLGGAPLQATTIGFAAASLGALAEPMFSSHWTLPQIELKTMSRLLS